MGYRIDEYPDPLYHSWGTSPQPISADCSAPIRVLCDPVCYINLLVVVVVVVVSTRTVILCSFQYTIVQFEDDVVHVTECSSVAVLDTGVWRRSYSTS